jgi:hypothetical protein
MDWTFTCLMVIGRPLNEATRTALYWAARRMAQAKNSRERVQGDSFSGMVATTYHYVSYASISGIKFTAELDAVEGSTKVSFVIPEEILQMEVNEDTLLRWSPLASTPQQPSAWMN